MLSAAPRNFWPRTLTVIGFALTLFAMGRICGNEFVDWDDRMNIAQNPKFNPPTLSGTLGYALPKNSDLEFYVPVADFAWSGLAAIAYVETPDATGAHLNPWVFHAGSVLVHLIGVVLVFLCLRQMLQVASDSDDDGDDPTFWPAWVGAMIFAVHPVQVEAIAWASGLKDVLSGAFTLASVYCFLRYRRNERINWVIAAFATCVLAMLSKPSGVAVPLVLLAIDLVLLRTRFVRSLRTLWPFFLPVLPIILITKHVQNWGFRDVGFTPWHLRPFIAGDALAFYAFKLLWPLRLTFDYGRTPEKALASWLPYVDWIVPVGILGLCCKARKNRLPLAGLLVALVLLFPVMGFAPFVSQLYSTVSDHYLYTALFGVSLLAAYVVRSRRSTVLNILAWLLIIAWACLSFVQSGNWQDNAHLAGHALAINPNSSNALIIESLVQSGNGDENGAKASLIEAVKISPRNGMGRFNLAMLLLHQGDADGALAQLEEIAQIYEMQYNADHKLVVKPYLAIAALMLKSNHPQQAVTACQAALKLDPQYKLTLDLLARAQSAAATTHPS